MTPEEIRQAREVARETVNPGAWFTPGHAWIALMARAVLALTEQQPEPVSEDTLTTFLYDTAHANLLDVDNDTPGVLAVELRRRYTITNRPASRLVSSPDGDSR